jgi:hypothetical protein
MSGIGESCHSVSLDTLSSDLHFQFAVIAVSRLLVGLQEPDGSHSERQWVCLIQD